MGRRERNPSVFDEPHQSGGEFSADPSEARVDRTLPGIGDESESQRVEHGVWDEPAITAAGKAPPEDAVTYAAWLDRHRGQVAVWKTWASAMLLALCAGPLAVIGTFWGSGGNWFSLLALVVFGPAVEEVMKTAAIA